MKNIRFIWDENKNITNQKKHNISFEEAKTVFYDDNARLIRDADHSDFEERFILLGLSSHFVCLSSCMSTKNKMRSFVSFQIVKQQKMNQNII